MQKAPRENGRLRAQTAFFWGVETYRGICLILVLSEATEAHSAAEVHRLFTSNRGSFLESWKGSEWSSLSSKALRVV